MRYNPNFDRNHRGYLLDKIWDVGPKLELEQDAYTITISVAIVFFFFFFFFLFRSTYIRSGIHGIRP